MIATRGGSAKPGYPEYLRGMAYYAENKLSAAKEEFVTAVQAGYQEPNLFFLLGMIESNQGNELAAKAHIDKVIEMDANHMDAYLQRGVLFSLRGEYTQAEASFDKVLESNNPNNSLALMHKGKMYSLKGASVLDNEKKAECFRLAAECYKKILEKSPTEPPLYLKLKVAVHLQNLQNMHKNLGIDVAALEIGSLIVGLKMKENKTIEERCVLFSAQAGTGDSGLMSAQETFLQLLNIYSMEKESLYDCIPVYLKQDFFSMLASFPGRNIQPLPLTAKVEQLKQAIVDLFKVRETEIHCIRVMQISAGLLALIPASLQGAILYVRQGWFTSPTLASGKLKEVVTNLTNGILKMREQEKVRLAGPLKLYGRAKTDLNTAICKESFAPYPAIHDLIFSAPQPLPQPQSFFAGKTDMSPSSQPSVLDFKP